MGYVRWLGSRNDNTTLVFLIGDDASAIFPKRNRFSAYNSAVPAPDPLAAHLARFLRERRGERTFAQFAAELGFTPSMLHRYENAQQSISLRGLWQIMQRLDCRLADIFPADVVRTSPGASGITRKSKP